MAAKRKVRAIALLSGGLDSLLAVKVLQEQGIEVVGLTFESPFFGPKNAKRGAEQLGIELIVKDISEEELELVKNPPHGFGKQMNPCIDCHAQMFRKAGEMLSEGYDFIATGEVLGERPMSQNLGSLNVVARNSGYADLLLRPLSAKRLKPTKPEREGLVDRERLLDLEGRSRKPQLELAKKFGIKSYVQPAGGCLLTDPQYSIRLKELLKFDPDATVDDAKLLGMGRHFRSRNGAKIVVGRDKGDNERIRAFAKGGDVVIVSDITPGPTAIVRGSGGEEDVELAARIVASFADNKGREVDMELIAGEKSGRIKAAPSPREEFEGIRI
jgi:tRNA-specific 2-thiouridylase